MMLYKIFNEQRTSRYSESDRKNQNMKIDLSKIHSPKDIKGMNMDQLTLLSDELRAVLLKKLSAHGGHVGPNLGVVEATVALHYIFNAPKDEIVFDVSHQSYVHKMLTGRIQAFLDPEHYNDVTGYTSPGESEYDLFEIGHTSTSIALATGLAKARDLKGGRQNVVAFIGDASLGGGMALEALNFAPTLGSNFILVVNDNQHSIAENHGELYEHLTALRESDGHAPNNIFKALGYEYHYVAEGNDIRHLIKVFEEVKDTDHAVVVHLNTMKGKGLPVAEADKETFHFSAPFDLKTGALKSQDDSESYVSAIAEKMLEKIQSDKNVSVLTAGTPGTFDFGPEMRKAAGRQFIDVGIAEQDMVAMAAGLAKGGTRPIVGVVSTFLQRAYDQLSHDVGINNLPVVFLDLYCGVFGMNDVTHLGIFDVAMVSNIPNIVMLSATNMEEYLAMFEWAMNQKEHPVIIRMPGGPVRHAERQVNTDFYRYDVVEKGADIAILAEGAMFGNAKKAVEILKKQGCNPTLIDPRILSRVDAETLDTLVGYKHVVTVDDGIIDGAFGEKVATYLAAKGTKVTCLGLQKQFMDRYNYQAILEENNLTPEGIARVALQ